MKKLGGLVENQRVLPYVCVCVFILSEWSEAHMYKENDQLHKKEDEDALPRLRLELLLLFSDEYSSLLLNVDSNVEEITNTRKDKETSLAVE